MHNRLDFDAIQSEIASRLDPNSIAIDGRDLRDRLAFVASVAELIIYYDENNSAKGNWLSLLLKDPVILLAVISKTDYQALHLRFSQLHPTIIEEKQRLQTKTQSNSASKKNADANSTSPDASQNSESDEAANHLDKSELDRFDNALVQLLTLLDQLFNCINHWWHHLEQNNTQFPLRGYIDKQIKQQLGQLLYQRQSLQTFIAKELPGCLQNYPLLDTKHFAKVWQVPPSYPQPPANIIEALGKLEAIYAVIFQFFVQVINEARPAFYKLVFAQNDFPDTSLIIACNELLKYSQSGLNQFSQKHLQFYYQKLLRQRPATAQPDFTYICLALDEKIASFNLPQNTAFVAGTYPDKSPILFENSEETELNQITLTQIQSNNYLPQVLNKLKDSAGTATHNKQTDNDQSPAWKEIRNILADSTQVRRNQQGQILSSNWFGKTAGNKVEQGFVLASPMFYLSSGLRTITLKFSLANSVTIEQWENPDIALSTDKGWQSVPFIADSETASQTLTSHAILDNKSSESCITLDIYLDESFPAVDTFKKAPEGFSADNYYCKIILPDTVDLTTQVIVQQLDIDVAVFNGENLALSADNALLINNKPMTIFGTTADTGSQCSISSPEAFSKPLTEMAITLDWDNLEANISNYFESYNNYLQQQKKQPGDKNQEETNSASDDYYQNNAYKVNWWADTQSGWQPQDCTLLSEEDFQTLQTQETTFSAMADEQDSGQPTAGTNAPSDTETGERQHQPFFKRVFNALKGEAIHIKEKVQHVGHEIRDKVEHFEQDVKEKVEHAEEEIREKVHEAEDKVKGLFHKSGKTDADEATTETSEPAQTQLFAQQKDKDGVTYINAPQSNFYLKFARGFLFSDQPVTALPSNKNPSLRLELAAPTDPFGSSLYATVVSYTTMRNAQFVMKKAVEKDWKQWLFDVISDITDSGPKNLAANPNPPYILKAKQARIHYTATQSIDFTLDSPAMTQDFSLLHIGNPNIYAYFQQSAGSNPPAIDFRNVLLQPTNETVETTEDPSPAGCAMFQGVPVVADSINISLQKIQAPCRLSLFIELAQNIGFEQTNSEIALYYWSNIGWQPLSVLSDGTQALSRSGLINLDIPEDIWLDSSIFTPVSKKPPPSPLLQSQILITHKGLRSVSVVYCNTQGVKLTRAAPIQLPIGETPNLAALSISKTQQKIPAISSLIQPFASVPGLPAESQALFRQRVSQRLKTKDRGSSVQDFVSLIKHTDPAIFYVKRLDSTAGNVRLGLVQAYNSADVSNAFEPVVPRANMAILQDALKTRISAMCQVRLSNLTHQKLQVQTKLIISESSNANELKQTLQAGIALYLSPWIKASQSQYSIADGLSKADLTRFIASFEDVLAVELLQFPGLDLKGADSDDILPLPNESCIWVSAAEHDISFTRSLMDSTSANGSQPTISLPQNVLTGGSV